MDKDIILTVRNEFELQWIYYKLLVNIWIKIDLDFLNEFKLWCRETDLLRRWAITIRNYDSDGFGLISWVMDIQVGALIGRSPAVFPVLTADNLLMSLGDFEKQNKLLMADYHKNCQVKHANIVF